MLRGETESRVKVTASKCIRPPKKGLTIVKTNSENSPHPQRLMKVESLHDLDNDFTEQSKFDVIVRKLDWSRYRSLRLLEIMGSRPC